MFYQLFLPGKEGEQVEIPYPEGFKFSGGQSTLGAVVSEALKYLYPLAGLILFGIIIFAGFQYLTSAGNEEQMKKASSMLTNAIIGFVILFVSFWLMKLLQFVFGFQVL